MPFLSPEIFKAYDIRGIVGKTLTPEGVAAIGRAIADRARERRQTSIAVGYDGRLSGLELASALSAGLQAGGMEVVDLGRVTTPMTYFAAFHLDLGGAVMVTGSHNPPDYNGLKIVIAGETLAEEAIQDLRRRVESENFSSGVGSLRHHDIAAAYQQRIVADVKLARPMNILVDAGNGVAGAFAPALYRALGCQVEELFCEVDGRFPNHHPDPSVPDNLKALVQRLRETDAEIGLAFDGDGDRLGVVSKDGSLIYPDRQLMLFAADILRREPGAQIIFDIKSTRNLYKWIADRGGRSVLWKAGHSLMKAKIKETGAALAGEVSGHIFFKERWYGFDDGLYAGARLLEILSQTLDPGAVLHALPESLTTPELHVRMQEGEPHALIQRLCQTAEFTDALHRITIDGLRVEYADGFGLIRASNTTPVLVLRFEGDTPAALARIQDEFRRILQAALPNNPLPF